MGMLDPAQGQSNFSLLGMLLGGRSYASNWLGQRDQINQQAMERQRIGTAAQGLLQSPEYKATNPDAQTQAQMGLWAKMQPDFSQMGNNLLSQQVGAMYQKQATTFSNTLDLQRMDKAAGQQKDATIFADSLERQRMGITYDDALKMDQIKRDRDMEDTKKGYQYLLGLPKAMGTTALLDKMGMKPPPDSMFTGVDDTTGMPTTALIRGSPTWIKGFDEISPLKNSADAVTILADMASGKTPFDQGTWNAVRGTVTEDIMKGKGTYDEGLKDFIDTVIPNESHFTPDVMKTKATQLQSQARLYAARASAASGKWGIPLEQVPSSIEGAKLRPNGPPPTDPPPGYGNDNKPAANAVAPERWDRRKPQAEKPGTGLLDTPGGQPARTRAWR